VFDVEVDGQPGGYAWVRASRSSCCSSPGPCGAPDRRRGLVLRASPSHLTSERSKVKTSIRQHARRAVLVGGVRGVEAAVGPGADREQGRAPPPPRARWSSGVASSASELAPRTSHRPPQPAAAAGCTAGRRRPPASPARRTAQRPALSSREPEVGPPAAPWIDPTHAVTPARPPHQSVRHRRRPRARPRHGQYRRHSRRPRLRPRVCAPRRRSSVKAWELPSPTSRKRSRPFGWWQQAPSEVIGAEPDVGRVSLPRPLRVNSPQMSFSIPSTPACASRRRP
jgi:hypothetical protein